MFAFYIWKWLISQIFQFLKIKCWPFLFMTIISLVCLLSRKIVAVGQYFIHNYPYYSQNYRRKCLCKNMFIEKQTGCSDTAHNFNTGGGWPKSVCSWPVWATWQETRTKKKGRRERDTEGQNTKDDTEILVFCAFQSPTHWKLPSLTFCFIRSNTNNSLWTLDYRSLMLILEKIPFRVYQHYKNTLKFIIVIKFHISCVC